MEKNGSLAVPTFVREWRKFRGLSQETLAERAELSTPSISQLENGNQGFTDKSLAALAAALDCTPAALLSYDPRRSDSLWPLFEAADKLEGQPRRWVIGVIKTVLAPPPGEPE